MTSDFQVGDHVVVDFDEALTRGEALRRRDEIEDLWEEIIERARQQYYAGPQVVISTARPWNRAYGSAARLAEWEVPYHVIRGNEGGSEGYIDDGASRPEEVARP